MSAASPISSKSSAPATAAGWLFGPVPDLVLGCGVGSIAILGVQLVYGPALAAWVPGALLILLFAVPHYGATLIRTYEREEDRRKYAFFSLHATVAIALAFVVGIYVDLVGSLILTVYLTWSPWHYTGQNYGIFLMLLGRRGVKVSPVAKRFVYASFILSFVLTFLAIHGVERSSSYAPVSYAGTAFRLLPLGIPNAVAGAALVVAALGYAACTLAAGVLLLRSGSVRAIAPSALLALTQALWFSLPVVVRYWNPFGVATALSGVYTAYGFLWIAAFHSLQYLWITTYYATSEQPRPARLRYLGKVALAGFAIWTLPALVFAPGLLGRLPYESGLGLIVAAVVNLHHFVLDGAIWKLRDGRVASILLRSARAKPGAESAAPSAAPQLPGRGWISRAVWAVGAFCILYGFVAWWVGDRSFARAFARSDIEQAQRSLERMAWLGRDGPTKHIQLGRKLVRLGEREAASQEFYASIELYPTPEAWQSLAVLHEERGQAAPAAEAYESALALAPRDVELLYRGGLAHLQAGDAQRAVELLERALALAPGERAISRSLERARRRSRNGARSAS